MNASRITSVSAAIFDGVGTAAHFSEPRRLVQCRNKSVEREVAVLAETARVLNLFQGQLPQRPVR